MKPVAEAGVVANDPREDLESLRSPEHAVIGGELRAGRSDC